MSPFFTVTIRDGAEKNGDATKSNEKQYLASNGQNKLSEINFLTINFQLNHLSNTRANTIVRLAQIETFPIFFHMLQQ